VLPAQIGPPNNNLRRDQQKEPSLIVVLLAVLGEPAASYQVDRGVVGLFPKVTSVAPEGPAMMHLAWVAL
jgi:hypothetical protein